MTQLYLNQIRLDGGTQPRAEIDMWTVQEYADAMASGAIFPPVTVFYDGTDYWLADGFHRYHATAKQETSTIDADVKQGTQRDAQLYSFGANAQHGLRRTNADKRRVVEVLLKDDEWRQWSDTKIAQQCGVTQPFVGKLRDELGLSHNGYKIVTRNGTTYTQDTANIGKRPEPTPEPEPFTQTSITDYLPEGEPEPELTKEELQARLEQAEELLAKAENTLDYYARVDGIGEDDHYHEITGEIDRFFDADEPDEGYDESDEEDSEVETPSPIITPSPPQISPSSPPQPTISAPPIEDDVEKRTLEAQVRRLTAERAAAWEETRTLKQKIVEQAQQAQTAEDREAIQSTIDALPEMPATGVAFARFLDTFTRLSVENWQVEEWLDSASPHMLTYCEGALDHMTQIIDRVHTIISARSKLRVIGRSFHG